MRRSLGPLSERPGPWPLSSGSLALCLPAAGHSPRNSYNTRVQTSASQCALKRPFCFFFYFPAPARRARDQHCFVRDNELFPASVRLARADTTGLTTDGKSPRPHGNPREGSSPRGAAQAPPEVRGAKKHASAQAEGGALGWTSTRRNTAACGRTTCHGVPHGRVRAMLTRSPGAQSAEHEALPTREPSGSAQELTQGQRQGRLCSPGLPTHTWHQ